MNRRRYLRRQALQQRVADAILDAAARTFATRGEQANLADVAFAAGVARATVYRSFPNRRRLLDELVRSAAEDDRERLEVARISDVAVEEGLTRAVRAFVDTGDASVVLARDRNGTEAMFSTGSLRARFESCSRTDVPPAGFARTSPPPGSPNCSWASPRRRSGRGCSAATARWRRSRARSSRAHSLRRVRDDDEW